MKSILIAAGIGVVLLSSCSVYRSGQTPDDVYYSPASEQQQGPAYVAANSARNDGRRYRNDDNYSTGYGYDDFATADDRWLMMRVRNRARWSVFDDYNYYNNFYSPFGYSPFASPFGYGGMGMGMGYGGFGGFGYSPGWSFGLGFGSYNPYGFGFYNGFNNYYNWNSYYNPYYSNIIIVNPKTNPAGYTRARSFNLNNYNNRNYSNSGSARPQYNNINRPRYNNSNNSRLEGSGRNNNYYNRSNDRGSYSSPSQDRPVRTYSPSNNNSSPSYNRSSGSSGSSNSSSGGGSGSRPSRR